MTYIKTNSLGAPKKPSYVVDSNWYTSIAYKIEDDKLKASWPIGAKATLMIKESAVPSQYAGSIYDDNVEMQLYISKYYLQEDGDDTWNNASFDYKYKITSNLIARIVLANKVITCTVIKNGKTISVGTLPMETEDTSILINYRAFNMRNTGNILFEVHPNGGETAGCEYEVGYDSKIADDKVVTPGFENCKITGGSNEFWPIFDGSLTKVKIKDSRQESGYLETTLLKVV